MKDRNGQVMKAMEKTLKLWAALLMALGLLAVVLPGASQFQAITMDRWILGFSGLAYLALALGSVASKQFLFRLLTAVAYLAAGVLLLVVPELSYPWVIFVLGATFGIEGALDFVSFLRVRRSARSGWILFNAIVALLLALATCLPQAKNSTSFLGILLGAKLVVGGASRLMRALALRKR